MALSEHINDRRSSVVELGKVKCNSRNHAETVTGY